MRRIVALCSVLVLSALASPMPALGQIMKESELFDAAMRDDAAAIRTLVSQGIAIDARDSEGRTALRHTDTGCH